MNPKLKGFFEVAQQKARGPTSAQDAAAEIAAARKLAREQNQQQLSAGITEELGPIFDALKTLPEKDGKVFSLEVIDRSHVASPEAEYWIKLSYLPKGTTLDFDDYSCEECDY